MCYINHLLGYISYFHTGFLLIRSKVWVASKNQFFYLTGSWTPLLFLNDEVCDSNFGKNELPGYLGLGGGVETVKPY
jgi:hypothetical protein